MLASLRIFLKIALPILVLGGFVLAGKHLLNSAPEQEKRQKPKQYSSVEVIDVRPQQYQTRINSSGTIEPSTQSQLVAEIAGTIKAVSPKLFVGSFVSKGDVLLEIDDTDYKQSITIIKAELAQAQLALEIGDAEREQFLRDRKVMGITKKPTALALGVPQRKSNLAGLEAAKARLAQARTKLKRTKVLAPYNGYIAEKQADVGQYVNVGSALATLYASNAAQVRLPLSAKQQTAINLTARLVGQQATGLPATISTNNSTSTWPAIITHAEGSIDPQSLQQYVVAQIDNPFTASEGRPALQIGQFIDAQIEGKSLNNVLVIPRTSLVNGQSIQVVDKDNQISNRDLNAIWVDNDNLVTQDGIQAGERLVKTPLPFASDGMQVRIAGEKVAKKMSNEDASANRMRELTNSLPTEQQAKFKALDKQQQQDVLQMSADQRSAFFSTL